MTLKKEIIYWNRKFIEELGEKDENGFYDYAYQYYLFLFSLPNNEKLTFRNYTDEKNKCSILSLEREMNSSKNLKSKLDENRIYSDKVIGTIIKFLESHGIDEFEYFNDSGEFKRINKDETISGEIEFIKDGRINSTQQRL